MSESSDEPPPQRRCLVVQRADENGDYVAVAEPPTQRRRLNGGVESDCVAVADTGGVADCGAEDPAGPFIEWH